MKKNILVLILSVLSGIFAFAQTTATDFTVNDCGGTPVHLFAELDAGKVIVLAMVDPCGSCINPAKNALTTVNSYASTNPGKVIYYLVDDFGNTSCTSLAGWGSTYGITGVVTISNTAVNQNSYGGAAMPKIVVVGGPSHTVYFKQDNGLNTANLTAAINQALTAAGIDEKKADFQFSMFPNPSTDKSVVSFVLSKSANVEFEIYNVLGAKVKTIAAEKMGPGLHETTIDFESLNSGVYFIKMNVNEASQIIRFSISR